MQKMLHRQKRFASKKGQADPVNLLIFIIMSAIIVGGGVYGGRILIRNAEGSACNSNLNGLDQIDKEYCVTYNVSAAANLPQYTVGGTGYAQLIALGGNKDINSGAAGGVNCPAGGTYSAPTTFQGGSEDPSYPTCSLSTDPTYSNTRYHSITLNP